MRWSAVMVRPFAAGLLLLVGTTLHGCEEELAPICTLEDLWDDWEHVNTEKTRPDDLETRMPKDCCDTLRAYLTEKHYIDGGDHKDRPSDELVEQAKAEKFQKKLDKQDINEQLYNEIVEEGEQEKRTKFFDNRVEERVAEAAADKADQMPELDDADPQKEKAIKEDAMARLQEAFDDAFCNAYCHERVVGFRVKKATTMMCEQQASFLTVQRLKDEARHNVSLAEHELHVELVKAELNVSAVTTDVSKLEHAVKANVTNLEHVIRNNVSKAERKVERTFQSELHHAEAAVENVAHKAEKVAHRAVVDVKTVAAKAGAVAVADAHTAEAKAEGAVAEAVVVAEAADTLAYAAVEDAEHLAEHILDPVVRDARNVTGVREAAGSSAVEFDAAFRDDYMAMMDEEEELAATTASPADGLHGVQQSEFSVQVPRRV